MWGGEGEVCVCEVVRARWVWCMWGGEGKVCVVHVGW